MVPGRRCVTVPRVASIWVESLGQSFEQALDLLAAAVRECTDELWESSMWEVPADLFGPEPPGPDGKPVADSAARRVWSSDARLRGAWHGTPSSASTTTSPVNSVRGLRRHRSRGSRTGC